MESLDTGKRLVESEIDIDDVTSVFRHFGLVADAEAGRVVDTGRDDVVSRVVHEPVGVCGLITPVELPAAAGLLEGRAGARGGLHVRAQAERALAAHRDPPDAPARRGRAARGRRQPRRGRRSQRRCRAQRGPARRPGLVHRRPRDRQADHGRRLGHGEEGRPRAGRQEPQHRLRRRRPRDRARHGAHRGVPPLRPGLLGGRAADRRGVDPRELRRRARPPGAATSGSAAPSTRRPRPVR